MTIWEEHEDHSQGRAETRGAEQARLLREHWEKDPVGHVPGQEVGLRTVPGASPLDSAFQGVDFGFIFFQV